MPSHPRFLSIVRAAVDEISVVYGLSEESSHGVTLAVDEAMANIIRHAYKGRYDQEFELNCEVVENRIEFRLIDHGEPPDASRICGQPLDEVSLSGRGTHIMKAIMDEMRYEQVPAGNQLSLVKYLPAGKAGVEGK